LYGIVKNNVEDGYYWVLLHEWKCAIIYLVLFDV